MKVALGAALVLALPVVATAIDGFDTLIVDANGNPHAGTIECWKCKPNVAWHKQGFDDVAASEVINWCASSSSHPAPFNYWYSFVAWYSETQGETLFSQWAPDPEDPPWYDNPEDYWQVDLWLSSGPTSRPGLPPEP